MSPKIVIRPENNFSLSIPGAQRSRDGRPLFGGARQNARVGAGDWLVGWFCVILLACEPTVAGSYLIPRYKMPFWAHPDPGKMGVACSKGKAPAHHRAPTPPPPCRSAELRAHSSGNACRVWCCLRCHQSPPRKLLTFPHLAAAGSCHWLLHSTRASTMTQTTPSLHSFDGRQQMWEKAGGMGRQMEAPSSPVAPGQGLSSKGRSPHVLIPAQGSELRLRTRMACGSYFVSKWHPPLLRLLLASPTLSLSLIGPARHFALLSALPLHPTPVSRPRHGRVTALRADLSCARTRTVFRLSYRNNTHTTHTPPRPPHHVPSQHRRHGACHPHQRHP